MEPDNPVNQSGDQAAAPIDLLEVLCNTSLNDLFCVHISSYNDLSPCIAFKFCCTLSHAVLNDNKDRTITVSVSRFKLIQGGSEPSQIATG